MSSQNSEKLQQRLVNYAADIVKFTASFPNDFASVHLAQQLIRSGTSVALNYGEARGAQSRRDFTHKVQLSLKELRECQVNLQILKACDRISDSVNLGNILREGSELLAIFVQIVKTLKSKN
jgi:four helix bundle protein